MDTNYFEHFDLPVSFQPNLEELRKRYLKISKENHPDFAIGQDDAYEAALLATSLNNQAYKVINDEFERIRYVLELKGLPVRQEDKLPPDFLMEMMEWNEEIMDAGMEEDAVKLKDISTRFESLEKSFLDRLNQAVSAYELSNDEALLTEIKETYLQRKYLLRLRDSIDKFARL